MYSLFKINPVGKVVNGVLRDLPSPSTIHTLWNFGSLLGLCLILQIITGLFLALHYAGDTLLSFEAVSHVGRDVQGGWLLRSAHANGASGFFVALYAHTARGLYFGGYRSASTWSMGVTLLLLTMATAFLGYVLPWGQMSFWGATVITSLFSALPHIGEDVVTWLWGGFAVDNPTLTRFFAFHFIAPFGLVAGTALHLLFLHQGGSSNPLGLPLNADKSPFHPYFTVKDFGGCVVFGGVYLAVLLQHPWALGDPENFIPANPLVTPVHIQPEWYFLFAYAILRAIPNKLGGVLALAGAVLILLVAPGYPPSRGQGATFCPPAKLALWGFFSLVLLLTWAGARPVETPYIVVSQGLTILYFSFFALLPALYAGWQGAMQYHKNLM